LWIGLSENRYGIHGAVEPSRVSKSESHGCVGMTNWDVERLAKSIRKGVEVDFVEGKQASR
jgi:lipoprotein-anchoring transpeptidase ErfK/SrfK